MQPYIAPVVNESLASKPDWSLKYAAASIVSKPLSSSFTLIALLLLADQRHFLITVLNLKLGLLCSNNMIIKP